ncbi:hypothetical protein CBR_g40413 [Chara braunii]|uniref:Uncharacterized protein n=1 Tax=Chara braunii TaxID=69332 RepID=A0A388LTT6_CHABU|nr:hypothetical protein CBR_g40413 [Chara braunii]|eukprot:GBG85681.1 hypothetical protein CBR_g40413 [Chara braunii]
MLSTIVLVLMTLGFPTSIPLLSRFNGCKLVAAASVTLGTGNGGDISTGHPEAFVADSSPAAAGSPRMVSASRRSLQSRRYTLQVQDALLRPNFGYYVLDAKGVESSAYAKDVLMTETEILYFLEYNDTGAEPLQCLKKAEKSLDPNSTSGYTISTVAGPWKMQTAPADSADGSSSNGEGFEMDGILVPGETGAMVLLTDHSAGVVRKVDPRTGQSGVFMSVDMPRRLAKHPTEAVIYISTQSCIYSVPFSESPFSATGDLQLLAGDTHYTGFVDATVLPLDSRFDNPLIGSRAIPANGSYLLYVADQQNQAVRCVDLTTGATNTIAGMLPPESVEHTPDRGPSLRARGDGSPHVAEFKETVGLAVTADGCNLFVAEGEGGVIRWLKLKSVGGDVIESRRIASLHDDTSNTTISGKFTSITLSPGDRYLLAGAIDARIYKMEINSSLLYKCGPSSAASAEAAGAAGADAAMPNYDRPSQNASVPPAGIHLHFSGSAKLIRFSFSHAVQQWLAIVAVILAIYAGTRSN